MPAERLIQALIIFSAILGVPFLLVVNGAVPEALFYFLSAGWVLFVLDSALTFFRIGASIYLGFALAVAVLASSVFQPAHYAFIESGMVIQSSIFIAGSAAQVLIVGAFVFRAFRRKTDGTWSWPRTEQSD